MIQFTNILKKINDKLDLPQPTKSRIILEIAADLEDIYNFHISQGLSESEAAQKAEEKFDLTDEAIDELVKVHQNLFKKFLDKLSIHAQSRWEKAILTIVLILMISLGVKAVLNNQFFLQSSKFIWPIIGCSLAIIVLSTVKFYNLFIKKDHTLYKLRNGLEAIAFLGITNIFLIFFGYFMEIFFMKNINTIMGSLITPLIISKYNVPIHNTVTFLIKTSSMIMFGILATLITIAILYIFINKIIKIELAETAFLIQK